MKDDKKLLKTNSSAEHVEQHLQELEKADYELLYYSQEQTFSADELARVINERRLNELMAQSDEFLSSLNDEIGDFDNTTVEDVKDMFDVDEKTGISKKPVPVNINSD